MGEITAITPQIKDKRRCNVYVDGRFYCGITLETAVKNRLKAGQTIDEKRLDELQGESENLLSCQGYDELRVKGELITAYQYKLAKGMRSCELENYYDDYKPMKITLDENLTPNANAQRYFKKYAKEKRAVEIVTPQKVSII